MIFGTKYPSLSAAGRALRGYKYVASLLKTDPTDCYLLDEEP